MNPEAESIQARLRQIDDYQSKGLLRAEEAEASRTALRRRLMELLVPDTPAPPMAWHVRAWSAVAMLVLVGSVSAYLISGHAGLRLRSEQVLAQGKIAAAQDEVLRRERIARIGAGQSLAPDQFGRFSNGASAAARLGSSTVATDTADASVSAASSVSSASGTLASGANADAVAPLLSGRIELDPKFESRVASDDALFVVVRLPDDPTGLPLATMRVEVSNLPFDFDIGAREMLGSPERFMRAQSVLVTARISKSGSGREKAGDLVGTSGSVAPWSNHVRILIDRVVPKS
jgi:hypothetical protein